MPLRALKKKKEDKKKNKKEEEEEEEEEKEEEEKKKKKKRKKKNEKNMPYGTYREQVLLEILLITLRDLLGIISRDLQVMHLTEITRNTSYGTCRE